MGVINKPRHGSLSMRPRGRASELTPRMRSWAQVDKACLLGFPVYKAGMSRLGMIDDGTGPAKGMDVTVPVTILEAPKISIFGLRAYHKAPEGLKCLGDVVSVQPKVASKLGMKKETKHKDLSWLESLVNSSKVSHVSVLALTNPDIGGMPQKKGEIVEIAIGGKDLKAQIDFAKGVLGKEVSAKDVFEEGEWTDSVSISRGHGWGGEIERFGVSKQRRKATGRVRHVGTLGPWHPPYVMYTAPQAGQVGFHRRTQYNVRILIIADENGAKKLNPSGGFPHYGTVKTDSLVVRGSVPGTQKRFIFLRKGIRSRSAPHKPQLTWT